jgi:hypothetical protein
VAEEVGRADGGCRVSNAGGVCLKRDWSAVISKAWARGEQSGGEKESGSEVCVWDVCWRSE